VSRLEQRLQRSFDVATAIAAIATVPVVVLLALDPPDHLDRVLQGLNWAFWAVFVVEVLVMLAVTSDRERWLREYPVTPVIAVLTVPIFGGLDLFRLVRLLRGPVARRAADAVTSEEGLRNVALLTLLTIGLGGVLFANVEPDVGVGDGLYWAVQTATTVGYGDVAPTTSAGKALAVYVMIIGVTFLAILTGAVAERFRARWRGDQAVAGNEPVLEKLDELGTRLAAIERAVADRR
jgi:voltage-gated potassium channel